MKETINISISLIKHFRISLIFTMFPSCKMKKEKSVLDIFDLFFEVHEFRSIILHLLILLVARRGRLQRPIDVRLAQSLTWIRNPSFPCSVKLLRSDEGDPQAFLIS